MACGIYSITNVANGKRYFGSTVFWQARKSHHRARLRRQEHPNKHLQAAWNKYGEDTFEFAFELSVHEPFLCWIEQIYLDANDGGYNKAKCAAAPGRGRKHTAAEKEMIRRFWIGRKRGKQSADHIAKWLEAMKKKLADPAYHEKLKRAHANRQPRSAATRAKMSRAMKGRKLSSEHRRKISASRKGMKLSAEHVAKMKKRRLTQEQKAAIGRRQNGKRLSDETKVKMRAAQSARRAAEKIAGIKPIFSADVKEAMRKRNLGKIHTEETKTKMRSSQTIRWANRKGQ
jgi:group I intron endonuclease